MLGRGGHLPRSGASVSPTHCWSICSHETEAPRAELGSTSRRAREVLRGMQLRRSAPVGRVAVGSSGGGGGRRRGDGGSRWWWSGVG
jgi:hypothetical protein